jgi:hypothetical protein
MDAGAGPHAGVWECRSMGNLEEGSDAVAERCWHSAAPDRVAGGRA